MGEEGGISVSQRENSVILAEKRKLSKRKTYYYSNKQHIMMNLDG